MRFLFTLLFSVFFFYSGFSLNIADYRFHTMPETSYYGGIHSIAKDSIGRIWFSGYDAVFVYNGHSFIQMNDRITRLIPSAYWGYGQVITDHSDRLYVATNQGLLRFNYQSQDFELVLPGNIGMVTLDTQGTMWLTRNNKVESFHPEELPAVTLYPLTSDIIISALACTEKQIYVGLKEKLYKLDKPTKQYSLFITLNDGVVIRDVIECYDSIYILTHMDGLYECDSEGKIVRHHNLSHEYEKSASTKQLYLDPSNILWISAQSGLFLLDPLTSELRHLKLNLQNAYSLPNNSVWSVFPDPDGGVWIGTYGGKLAYMSFFDNNVNYFKATPGGLSHPIVSCFEEDKKGNLWIGTEGGGLNYWDRTTDKITHFTQDNNTGVTSNMIKMLKYDEKGKVLQMSAFNGGMSQFDENKGRFMDLGFYHPQTLQQLSIYDFLREGDSGIWLTDPDSELMYRDNKKGTIEIVTLSDSKGMPVSLQIETLFHDKQGNLWLITHSGAYVVDVNTRRIIKHYYLNDKPYVVNNLCSFCVTSDSDVWFGTRGRSEQIGQERNLHKF